MTKQHNLIELLSGIYVLPEAEENILITSVVADSRQCQTGTLFLACQGETQHGAEFLEQALASGAACVLIEDNTISTPIRLEHPSLVYKVPRLSMHIGQIAQSFYGNLTWHAEDIKLIGITGTNGKTSVSHYISQLLYLNNSNAAVLGTVGNGIWPELNISTHTTQDCLTVHKNLDAYQRQGASYAAMEVSSHALAQRRLAGLKITGAVFTNLTQDHLDYHGSMFNYGATKLKLFTACGALSFAVLNLDDVFSVTIYQQLPKETQVVFYSTQLEVLPENLQGENTQLIFATQNTDNRQIEIHAEAGSGKVLTQLIGEFNTQNLLAAVAVVSHLGLEFNQILDLLPEVAPVAGRMESLQVSGKPLVVIDYAHTPDALENVLRSLRPVCQGRLICVFGCGGDRDKQKRPLMGQVVFSLADTCVVTDDNPRNEPAEEIIQDILAATKSISVCDYQIIHDRRQAIATAIEEAKPNDIVLIAGKGHEQYQLIKNEYHDFCDKQEAQKMLRKSLWRE